MGAISPPLMGALALAALLASAADAYPTYRSVIPNAGIVPNPSGSGVCEGVGHLSCSGGGARNFFGEDFAAQGRKWTPELCELDSDGDGLTNGQELGDPCCRWSPGSSMKLSPNASHPGFSTSKLLYVQVCGGGVVASSTLTALPKVKTDRPYRANTEENNIQRNHGIIMAFSWGLLIPLGTMAARYIPAFGKSMFILHLVLQLSGIALTLAALIQILVMLKFDSDVSGCKGQWGKFLPHDSDGCRFWMLKEGWQYDHGRVGVTVVIIALLQPLNAAFRPKPGTTAFRRVWELFHTFLGKAAIMLGIFNVFFGIYVYTVVFGGDNGNWRPWIGLVVASVATINIVQAVIDKYLRERAAVPSEPEQAQPKNVMVDTAPAVGATQGGNVTESTTTEDENRN